jgi:hypothetical protein
MLIPKNAASGSSHQNLRFVFSFAHSVAQVEISPALAGRLEIARRFNGGKRLATNRSPLQGTAENTKGRPWSHPANRPVSLSGFSQTRGDPVFTSGKEAKQVAVGNGAEGFRAVAVVAQAAGGKDQGPSLTIFDLKAVERREGNAISAIEMVKGFKEFGFALMALRLELRVWLRCRFGAGTFGYSHGLPAS